MGSSIVDVLFILAPSGSIVTLIRSPVSFVTIHVLLIRLLKVLIVELRASYRIWEELQIDEVLQIGEESPIWEFLWIGEWSSI